MEKQVYILPQPQHKKDGNGSFVLKYDHRILLESSCKMESYAHACLLQQEVEEQAGLELEITRGGSKKAGICLAVEESDQKEGYRLTIEKDGVRIVGGSARGLLYGVQTLRQILRQKGANLPFMEIEDCPQMANRGFYHDVTRGRVPKLSWLKKLADILSFYKMNQLQLYIEHTYLFEGLSEMWRDDTPLTAQDILELDEYCAGLGIELVPSLSSFGHLYKLLRTSTYCELCEMPEPEKEPFSMHDRMAHHTINASREESYELLTGLIGEYMSLFRSQYFNIGADETFDLGKGATKEIADKSGVERLYIDFVNKLCQFVVSKGKIPMFWGDVICGFPEYIRELPKETICLNWGYAPDQSEESTEKLAKAGAVQYVCPGVGGWNQFMNLYESCYQNISRMCTYGAKHHAIGMLNTDWGDFGHVNDPSLSIPGIIYGAAFSWNLNILPKEEIDRQISRIAFGDRSETVMAILSELSKKSVFGWWKAVMYQEAMELQRGKEKEYLLGEEEQKCAAQSNGEIQELMTHLAAVMEEMDSSMRKNLRPCFLAGEAMHIFNCIGLALSGKEERQDLITLAEDLEHWFYHYKKQWRVVSQESELFQVTHIICWYADWLRDLAKGEK